MKICFISTMPANRWGGSEELWAAAARYALEQKQEVLISAPLNGGVIHEELTALKGSGAQLHLRKERDDSSGLERVLYKIKRLLNNIPPVPACYHEFLETVKQFNPDVVCINQGGAFNVVEHHEVVWLTKTLGKPFSLIVQSNLEHRVYHQDYLVRIREIYKAARKIYFISQRNLEVAKRQLATSDFTNYELVKNPCRITDRRMVDYPANATAHFAMVGRLQCRNKGHDVLFQTLAQDVWNGRDWFLNIYGTGDDRQYLEELAAYYGISGKIKFQGWEKDVRIIWQKNHILVMPSIEEGTPLALIEAMACGRAALVTDVGDNAELIKEGENGFVAEAPTPKLVAAALERAWSRKSEWKELGEKAYRSVAVYIEPQPGKRLVDSLTASIQK